MVASEQPMRKVKRSLILDADMIAWIEQRARSEDLSDSQVVRRLIRSAMNAERQQREVA